MAVESSEVAKRRYLHKDEKSSTTLPQAKVGRSNHVCYVKQHIWKICHEMWPTHVNSSEFMHTCTRCKRDKCEVKLYSADNMDLGEVSPCLEGLTQVEKMFIARGQPIMSVYCRKGGQHGYTGPSIDLPQDIQTNFRVISVPFLAWKMATWSKW